MAHPELGFLFLMAAAAVVAVLSQRARLPYAIGLVVAGVVIGNAVPFSGPHLSKDLLFLVVLPGLLFEAAFQLNFAELWRARWSVLVLAVPGVIVATLVTAALVWWSLNTAHPGALDFVPALVFGALISATDPISVLAVFKNLQVEQRLSVIVEAESLFNDGTAVVLYTIALAIAAGHEMSVSQAGVEFVRVTGLAVVVGMAVGGAVSLATRVIDDPMVDITLTVLSAYGAFIAADFLGLSGVIACVVSGIVTGGWGPGAAMRQATRAAVDAFWTYTAFVLNSVIFLLMGIEIQLRTLSHFLPQIVLAWVAINVARALVIYGKYAITRLCGNAAMPWSWAPVLWWGGLRGGLSMVLALALPANFKHRDLIMHMTFGVVLLTLLVQGLTISALLRRLRLVR